MAGQCCPAGSLPCLQNEDSYTPRGETMAIGTMDACYVTGNPAAGKTIIVAYDIFGLASGRIRGVCDHLADTGFYVVCPDLYRGSDVNAHGGFPGTFTDEGVAWMKTIDGAMVSKDLQDTADFIKAKGADTNVCVLGFCWGAWVVFRACAELDIKAGASAHPSLQVGPWLFNEDLAENTNKVNCPQLLLPAGQDPDSVKPGGEVVNLLEAKFPGKCEVHVYPDMQHGWVVRGDTSQPEVEAAVNDALARIVAFFNANTGGAVSAPACGCGDAKDEAAAKGPCGDACACPAGACACTEGNCACPKKDAAAPAAAAANDGEGEDMPAGDEDAGDLPRERMHTLNANAAAPLSTEDLSNSAWFQKRGKLNNKRQKRFLVLEGANIKYYKQVKEGVPSALKGEIAITADSKPTTNGAIVMIANPGRNWDLLADTEAVAAAWCAKIAAVAASL